MNRRFQPILLRHLPAVSAALAVLILPDRASADQVIADDVIIQGSLGVGTGAVNNESFGFDTIRLKQENLRIHFEDTSVGSFPTNDWRILINDVDGSGSGNYFAIQDSTSTTVPFRIDAGAEANTLFMTGTARIGLFTNTPATAVHMNVTYDAMDATKSVLIGPETVTPAGALLQVHGPVYLSKDGGADLTIDPNSDTRLYVEGGAMFSRNIEIGSSRELKEDIRDLTLDEAKNALTALRPVEYRYIGDPEKQLGFIAEEVPDLVATDSRRSLSPMDFVAVLTKVVQNQEDRMEAQDKAFETLKHEVETLLKESVATEPATPGRTQE